MGTLVGARRAGRMGTGMTTSSRGRCAGAGATAQFGAVRSAGLRMFTDCRYTGRVQRRRRTVSAAAAGDTASASASTAGIGSRASRVGVAAAAALDVATEEGTAFDVGVSFEEASVVIDGKRVLVSGLNGKALHPVERYPTQSEVMATLPKRLFKKDTFKSMLYAIMSTSMTVGLGLAAYAFIPLKAAWTPVWLLYAAVTGTVATGSWVVAHECGHGAFSDNKKLQDAVGYVLHSLLLVPYFSWQRSHAVHHMRTNHLSEGETHVPKRADIPSGGFGLTLKEKFGNVFGIINLIGVLGFGWPAYLINGASGGPVRGKTNHFNPRAGAQGRHALFPGKWAGKVWQSDVGIAATVGLLGYWVYAAGSVWPMLALYMGPYMVVNAWLVGYTWLQHTDVDIPHFDEKWSWAKGTFMTVDRPYGPVLDFLHHRIGSTHVAHHVNHTIPHYNALEATNILKAKFPDLYLYDPTPIHKALWRINTKCIAVRKFDEEKWVYTDRRVADAGA